MDSSDPEVNKHNDHMLMFFNTKFKLTIDFKFNNYTIAYSRTSQTVVKSSATSRPHEHIVPTNR